MLKIGNLFPLICNKRNPSFSNTLPAFKIDKIKNEAWKMVTYTHMYLCFRFKTPVWFSLISTVSWSPGMPLIFRPTLNLEYYREFLCKSLVKYVFQEHLLFETSCKPAVQ